MKTSLSTTMMAGICLLMLAAPAAAGPIDWGLCPDPTAGAGAGGFGGPIWAVEASSADDSASGGKSCTLRDAIETVVSGSDTNGCSQILVSEGAGESAEGLSASQLFVVLPSGTYTYTLDGFELFWVLDPLEDSYHLCGHGAETSLVRAAATSGTAGHRVLSLSGTGTLRIHGVAIANGETVSIKGLAEPEGGPPTTSDGAGVLAGGSTWVELYDSLLTHNQSAGSGGGLACYDGPDCYTLERTMVLNNAAQFFGGGLFGRGPIRSSFIAGNFAGGKGGGLYTGLGPSPFPDGAEGGGGTVYYRMHNTWINGNSAFVAGGGWWNGGYGDVESATISSNTALVGGGLFVDSSIPETLHNVTLSGNWAESPALGASTEGETPVDPDGGGLMVVGTSGVDLYNATISNNRIQPDEPAGTGIEAGPPPPLGAGLLVVDAAVVTYRQSFIAGNFLYGGIGDDDCLGGLSAGYNRGGVGCDLGEAGDGPADANELLLLADWGGRIDSDPALDRRLPTGGFLLTHALADASDAIDGGPTTCAGDLTGTGGGSTLPTDARGFARVDGDNDQTVNCDIGAFEYKGNPVIWIDGFDDAKQPPCNWSNVQGFSCGKG